MAALPGTFDHAPQILWELAIITGIGNRDAASRNHDWLVIERMLLKDSEAVPNAARVFHTCPDVKTKLSG